MRVIRYIAQLLTAIVFLLGGMQAFREPAPRAARAGALGLPESQLGVQVNAAIMVAGGAALALDFLPRVAAAVLAASLIPTTIIGHAFWNEDTPAARSAQQTQFAKNLAALAALLFIVIEPSEHKAGG